ncbi:RNA methyltransferase [Azospira sp. APE16]|jgi:tRNA/rRNA methyltransferase|uniref:tRNA (cytidine/uridine-2'-O-)-methyltransferase TrmJ n=1 Tax=Azospira oryzae TaxID=146939 RepID=A0ABY0IRR0_9RHOO|nr:MULTISPECIES: RNA methyltransferase [Azospira]TLS20009.1 MAG: RNA methyltransferase [Betaproteobacteria bacterium]MBP7489411.1 RNA methyltransferase [Azospira sp.]MDK9692192.1 RNA methyltransferase [Azospira sp.]RZT89757.1 tRNA/rRNA methyltransferase [Azospira oryzae]BBN87797.1 tRNA (cytidine/uridine-2'-O-)-methyltransferase TrmJ [Azospira sp. I09]
MNPISPIEMLGRIRVVLCNTSHPGNIGAAARAMKTMGLSRLTLVNPKQFPDDEATARASGAADVLEHARICTSLEEALQGTVLAAALSARQRDLGPIPRPARQAVPELLQWTAQGDIALVFGGETSGLTNAEVEQCQRLVTVPVNPDYGSLNLGAAVQVLCYEVRQAAFDGAPPVSSLATPFATPPASHEEVEGFYAHLERLMTATGFLNPNSPRRLMPKLRRLFGRAALEKDEINILRGILAAAEKPLPGAKINRDNS